MTIEVLLMRCGARVMGGVRQIGVRTPLPPRSRRSAAQRAPRPAFSFSSTWCMLCISIATNGRSEVWRQVGG